MNTEIKSNQDPDAAFAEALLNAPTNDWTPEPIKEKPPLSADEAKFRKCEETDGFETYKRLLSEAGGVSVALEHNPITHRCLADLPTT